MIDDQLGERKREKKKEKVRQESSRVVVLASHIRNCRDYEHVSSERLDAHMHMHTCICIARFSLIRVRLTAHTPRCAATEALATAQRRGPMRSIIIWSVA